MVTAPVPATASGSDTANVSATATAGAPLNATVQSVSSKSIDESLWWDSFVVLLEELDSAPHSSDVSANLIIKLKRNHSWFLNSVSHFKSPNEASRLALDSNEISLGVHRIAVKPNLKEAALRASKCEIYERNLVKPGNAEFLDEVQTYILVSRSFEHDKSIAHVERQDFLQWVMLFLFFCIHESIGYFFLVVSIIG
ncbi:hypothetical protein KSP40_PGU001245 [Platanthera guangdongensis]|uniref:Uncharacterized protein n=1 Tax=Platanthera guangdongensis TaxID=2320717 RepID=A0ABR2MSX7_9ASPA